MKKNIVLLLLLFTFITNHAFAQLIDTSQSRVKTDFKISFPFLGTVKPRSTVEIESSNWLIGCETLDRDFTDYDQYKTYIAPLGIKRLRMQAGWNKTEKIKGTYDWAWLDHIIDDANKRGLKPWLQTSYGNERYEGGGGANLGAGMPTSKEALEAWDKWVTALVTRYKDKVKDWEVWNEPNFGDNLENTPEKTAALHIRTIDIIKKFNQTRKYPAYLWDILTWNMQMLFKILSEKGKLKLFDNMTYHDYTYNPDSHYGKVMKLRAILDKYAPNMPLRQGENGAPSGGGSGRGALWDYDWTELTQAKWDTRRMLGDLGHDIETSVFGLVEMAYTNGPINRLNYKGIIKSDTTKQIIRPKIAYYSIQNVTSIFDHSLQRIKKMEDKHNKNFGISKNDIFYSKTTDRNLSVYGYQHKVTKKQIFTIWIDEYIPTDSNQTKNVTFTFANANFDQPVFVDIITGGVYEIPANQWSKTENIYTFKDIPVYDAPILIADRSLIQFK